MNRLQRLLEVARLQPALKLADRHFRHRTNLPVFFIVSAVSVNGAIPIGVTQHHLVLVKRAIWVYLVDHKHPIAIWVLAHEHINLLVVSALGTAHISIVSLQLVFPLAAVRRNTRALGTFRVLNRDIQAMHSYMPLLVVPRLLLGLGRLR